MKINKKLLDKLALDSLDILVGPSGLLLVGSDHVLSQVHGWGLESLNK
jgi:hypothetical protein